jgi:hypothetical protein
MIDMSDILGGVLGGMLYSTILSAVHMVGRRNRKVKIQKKYQSQKDRIEARRKKETT